MEWQRCSHDELQLSSCSLGLVLCSSQSEAGCWHMLCTTELLTAPSLPSLALPNQQDRNRALEITAGCEPPWECLCSHLRSPPALGKIFISVWTVNYHTAALDYVFILSSFFSWSQFTDVFTQTFFSYVFFPAAECGSFS